MGRRNQLSLVWGSRGRGACPMGFTKAEKISTFIHHKLQRERGVKRHSNARVEKKSHYPVFREGKNP